MAGTGGDTSEGSKAFSSEENSQSSTGSDTKTGEGNESPSPSSSSSSSASSSSPTPLNQLVQESKEKHLSELSTSPSSPSLPPTNRSTNVADALISNGEESEANIEESEANIEESETEYPIGLLVGYQDTDANWYLYKIKEYVATDIAVIEHKSSKDGKLSITKAQFMNL